MPRPLLALCVFLAATAFLAAQELQLKIFRLANRPAASAVELVRPMLSEGSTLAVDDRTNALVIRDRPEVLETVAALLEQIDVPAPMARIIVDFTGVDSASRGGAGVAYDPRTGRVGVAAGARDSTTTTSQSQNLLVMSGEEGRIEVGRDIVAVQPFWNVARGWGLIPPGVIFRRISSGFVVSPSIYPGGDTVKLSLMPWFSYDSPEGRGDVRFTEAATTVSLHSGDTVVISSGSGGSQRSTEVFGLILGGGGSSTSQSGTMTLTARIVQDWRTMEQ